MKRRLLLYGILVFLVIWPVYQIYEMAAGHAEKEDAGKLLYQVSLFQMELLGSFMQDADKKDTGALNDLRQALYTANFTHEHLVLAYGEDQLTPLSGLSHLMQYVIRLQIGGNRPMRSEESQAMLEARKLFAEMYDAYSKLLSSHNEIVASQNERLIKADKAMQELLRKKLLQ
ncbi:S-adenosylmethionine decarboxylase [Paenibacillus rigui]|uniref:S-adenosylmethionine decarboxylase n=1 Tax=Paenibacillus rigui TaxID=554312 RepID=A0A229UTU0_9BACL|nr:S-adenosylmethionine decarboxylase [Paenibacillus rigui]OXM86936.1 S-adenosylmethionine decarboxylase [Paenibacillus rigui]